MDEAWLWSFAWSSGLLLEVPGAEELVGEVRSIGSPRGDGAEVFIVGVGVVEVIMGTVLAAMISCAGSFPIGGLEALSIAVAMGSVKEKKKSNQQQALHRTADKEGGGMRHGACPSAAAVSGF